MNKKQLRQRIEDIAAGAGMTWQEGDYWDGFCGENLCRFMEGLTVSFDLDRQSHLTHFVRLDDYDDLEKLVDLFFEHLKDE